MILMKNMDHLSASDEGIIDADVQCGDVLSEASSQIFKHYDCKILMKLFDDEICRPTLCMCFYILQTKNRTSICRNVALNTFETSQKCFDLKEKSRRSVEEDRPLLTSSTCPIDGHSYESNNTRLYATLAWSGKPRRSVDGSSLSLQAYSTKLYRFHRSTGLQMGRIVLHVCSFADASCHMEASSVTGFTEVQRFTGVFVSCDMFTALHMTCVAWPDYKCLRLRGMITGAYVCVACLQVLTLAWHVYRFTGIHLRVMFTGLQNC